MKMNKYNITKKDMDKVFFRWITRAQSCWNYETMQGLGYCSTIYPILKKIYTDKNELKEMMKLHLQFFNTNVVTGGFVLGADTAIEANNGYKSKDMIPAIKTGLMGPLAGVGDTFFTVTINTVLGSIAAYMALQGNPIGIVLWLIGSIIKIGISRWFAHLAFDKGQKVVSQISGTLKKFTDSSTVLGMTVVGALIPTVINITLKLVPTIGELKVNIQEEMLDKMLPQLLPVLAVAFVYWLLGKKYMNSTRVLLIIIALSILLNSLGII
ncbi:hypothetical protein BHAMNSH16_08400 [Brachyspira hampsonii]|uniref:PTS fructose transporter subunit IID n=2 Tax=Brachyspira hampsonii TaxID=1287055 RepID=A0AAC9XKU5_9SPIR|nr:hypothetical protein BHAMNSH16_08400 [Brachyspira hampsonii]OEJ12917.1 hypothetical protein A9496_02975 [Brachyspira hampsonii]